MSGTTPGRLLEETVPLVDMQAINRPYREELLAAAARVIDSADFGVGEELAALEDALAPRLEVRRVVGVHSGTAALHLALLAAGVGPGDEVVLPPNSFFATAEAILAVGATPVFADVDPSTALLDVQAAAAAVTARTAAIVPVHLYGQPVDADAFRALARRHGLFFLEDAAQAIGGAWNGRAVGSLGDAAAFSFYPTKNLGALGQAGAVATDDRELAGRIALLRAHGEGPRHVHTLSGFNERMNGMQAAFLRVKLAHLDDDQRRRDEAAGWYAELLADVPGVSLFETRPEARHVHHLLVVKVAERDRVLETLHRRGIGAAIHYPTPIHLQPVFAGVARRHPLEHAEQLSRSILTLPLYPGITREQVELTVETVVAAVKEDRAA